MRLSLLLAVLVTFACGYAQNIKSRYSGVKGGYGQGIHTGENLLRVNDTQSIYGGYRYNQTESLINEKGVCYIEVPTARLAKDPSHVPAGNGSRPDLSRIRTCCEGYTKNIHNFKICDPVCTPDCVNALCTAPNTCTCFPDHVKNQAGFCIPTCPIGCQNGQCSGGECICQNGYRLDSESKYCIPVCTENCGGIGNCTAPNTCECKTGYRSSPGGSCKPHCDRCGQSAECVGPNDCRCRGGYTKNQQGDCIPQCANNCQPNGQCVAPNVCNYITTTTVIPNGRHTNQTNVETVRPPTYPGNQQQPTYPGNQRPPAYPGNQQQPAYPGNQQQPAYPGNHQQPAYPGNQQQPSYYPGYQQSNYPYPQPIPGNQLYNPSNRPGYYQPINYPNKPSQNSDSQTSNSGYQPFQYPSQNPSIPDSKPIYYNPNQQPSNYPSSQNGYYEYRRLIYDDDQQQNAIEPYYPGSRQFYPINQQYYPQYGPQGNYPNTNQSSQNPSYTSQQQSQVVHSDSQQGNVETLCTKPCVNGVCVGLDRCSCNEGYVLDDTDTSASRCKPYCPGGCPNGVCSSPYICICNLGYYKDHSVKGRANCVKRIRRSIEEPLNIADLLIFEIPDDEDVEDL